VGERGQEIVRVLLASSSLLATKPSKLFHENPRKGVSFACFIPS